MQNLMLNDILNKKKKIAVVGLGYVGLPIAVGFSEYASVIGFDLNDSKTKLYRDGIDPTNEVGEERLKRCSVEFTSDESKLKEASFIVVAVPTPVRGDKTPDLSPLESASEIVGKNLSRDTVVVFESTVYPGVTEEVCLPLLERFSEMTCPGDFTVGYSPERINPGDDVHRLDTIVKIVSGYDADTLETMAGVYSLVAKAGVYRAGSIKVAEAAKVIENSQRDINIAFVNELSMIFHKLGIDTNEVLDAAGTKWNFLNFRPGLVGGHCIGVDPYYLTYKADLAGYKSQIILSGRRINDDMGKYAAESLIKDMSKAGIAVRDSKIALLGFTFKENCPDTRNTKVIDIIETLGEYGVKPVVCDPVADSEEAFRHYGIRLVPLTEISGCDAVIIAVAHDVFKTLVPDSIDRLFGENGREKIIYDLKNTLERSHWIDRGYVYWSL